MWFKHRISRRIFAFVWAGTAAVVITVALAVSIARLLLPFLDHYRVQIEQFASQQIGRTVLIGEISAGWEGLQPDLRLRDVRILNQNGDSTWLSMAEVRASLDVIDSLRHARLETGQIGLVGGSLEIVRHDDGSFSVAGIATGSGGVAGHGGRRLLQWLMARDRVYLEGATVRWHDARVSQRPLQISDLSLDLRGGGGHYRLGGAGRLAGVPEGALRFALDLSGDPRQPDSLRSSLYLDGRLVLGSWLDGTLFTNVAQLGGALEFQLWADGADRLERLRGKIEARELLWQPEVPATEPDAVAVRFDQAEGTLFWRQLEDGWRLGLEQVQVVRDHRQWPTTGLQLSYAAGARGAEVWELSTPFARLEDLNAVLLTVPTLPTLLRQTAAQLQPRGDLHQVALRYDPAALQGGSFAAARFQDLSMQPWLQLPGLTGLDGHVRANAAGGVAELDSRGVAFSYPRLFRQPLQADTLAGRLFWRRDQQGLHLNAPRFVVANADAQAQGRLRMELPAGGASPFTDLVVDFRDAMVGRAPDYLPAGIMPDKVVAWLDRALASGRAPHGRVILFGRLTDFPYHTDTGTFRVDFGVEDLILDYGRDWPRLEEAVAGIRFADRSFHADIFSGRLLGLAVGRSQVDIDRLGREGVLTLDTEARGALPEFLSYLVRGPLSEDPPAIVQQLETAQDARAEVDLRLPLTRPEAVRVRGALHFSDNVLAWPAWALRFEQIEGRLDFAYRDGRVRYDADQLQLQWRSAPARLSVHTSEVGDETQVQLDLNTHNRASNLLGSHGRGLDRVLSGATDWQLRATVHQPHDESAPASVGLQVESDLRGATMTLPSPLHKPASEKRPLLVQARLDQHSVQQLRGYYGSLLNGVFALEGGKLARGEVRLGPAQAELPAGPGLRLAGAIDQLSVGPWRQWLGERTAAADGEAGWLDALNTVDLRVDALEALGQTVHGLHVGARRNGQRWVADVSAEELAGRIQLPLQGGNDVPIEADLQRLFLTPAGQDDTDPGANAVDPTALPALRLNAEQFRYGDLELGALALTAEPAPSGLRITKARIEGEHFQVDARGEWLVAPRGQVSEFIIDASTDSLGRTLDELGYSGTIEKGEATLYIQAQWPGAPADFALKNLDGRMRLLLKDGQLLALDPRGGRIFGLLSLQALPRRLSLDFSDLFRRGFAFDRIQGSFTIADGDAYTNDLYMEGPAARIDVAGRIGLASEDYDQSALVTPRVSASIPVVGGLAGGPAVGVGLWVAERMFGKKIDELSRVRYNITGPWRDPQVERADDPG